MVKKVFAIIGIVLGSVAVFVGAVLGVYALMGRFRTPVVYPTRLEFVDSEQTIINDNQNGLYYFILNGYSNNEYEVNQRTCFIDVLDGTDLIQLCSFDGTPLSEYQDDNGNRYPNRYQINCNDRIYYRLREISSSHFNDDTYGRILIQARDERGQVQSNQLTIWVDRQINEVYLGEYNGETPIIAGEVSVDGNEIVQTIPIGLEISEYFNVISTPNYSLHPISNLDAKIVEIYYFDSRNYILIDDDTILDYEFLHIDSNTNQIYFESEFAGTYTFKIAVFDTYASREEYLNDASHNNDSNFERINNMVNTTVVFNVINSDVERIGMNSTGVAFNLYNESSIVLSSTSSTATNNLGLYMIQDGRETFSRFNEVDFTLNNSTNWENSNIVFESADEQYSITLSQSGGVNQAVLSGFTEYETPNNPNNIFGYVINLSTSGEEDNVYNLVIHELDRPNNVIMTLTLVGSNIALEHSVDDLGAVNLNRILVDRLTCNYNDITINLTSASGSAFIVLGESSNSITKLTTGSYLEFYIHNVLTDTFVRCDALNYSVTSLGSGREKTFNLVMQNIPELGENENLVLGAMVVNGNGENHFAYVSVNIQAQDLVFSNVSGNSVTLDIGYELIEEQYVTVYDSLNFDEIISVTAGSYDACVFVTPYRVDGNYDVEVLNGVTFIDRTGNSYVLVGTFEGGSYHNVVRARNGSTNVGTTLYVIQLRNAYQQTAEEYINDVLFGENVVAQYEFILDLGEDESTSELVNVGYSIEDEQITLTANLVNSVDINVTSVTITNGNLVITLSNGQTLTNPDLVKFFIDNGAGGIDVLLSDKSGASEGVADVVDAYILSSRAITVNTRYSIIAEEIEYAYNEQSELGGDSYITKDEQGNIHIVEDTTNHTLTIHSDVEGMIENMFNTNFSSSNISVRLYNASGELLNDNFVGSLVVNNVNLSENRSAVIVNYDIVTSLVDPTYYLKVCLTYNGVAVESAPIYITSTAPTDIEFAYTTNEGEEPTTTTFDLYSNIDNAQSGSTYIEIEVGYDSVINNDYTFTYQLVTSNGNYPIGTSYFNTISDSTTTNGFIVSPVIAGKTQSLTYTSLNNDILSFSTVEGQNIVTPNSTGSVVIAIQSGAITRYLRVQIVDNGNFSLTRVSSEVNSSSFNLSEVVSYTYLETSILNNSRVNIQNVTVPYFGGGRQVEVVAVTDGFDVQTVASDMQETETVLEIRKTDAGWTFTRVRYQTVSLNVSFDVVTLTGSVTSNITFNSSIRINQNSNWTNYYQGISALLFETSSTGTFTNNSIFRITTQEQGLTVSVLDPDNRTVELGTSGGYNNVIVLEKLGTYRVTFSNGETQIEELSFTVEPNLILERNLIGEDDEPLRVVSDTTYDLSQFITISAYDTATSVIYGTGTSEIYSSDNLNVVEDYSTVFNDENNIITMSSNLTTNSLFTLNRTDFEISTGWIERIGSSVSETLTFHYNYRSEDNTVNRNYSLGSIEVTAENKYDYELLVKDFMAETAIDFTTDSDTNNTNMSGYELVSVEYVPPTATQISVTYNPETKMFSFTTTTGQIEPISNAILRFTFSAGASRTLVYYTTEADGITISPYVPSENNEIATAYSNNQYDLLNDIYNLDNVNSIVTSFLVTNVSDPTAFVGSNTSFVGSGFVNGSETQTGLSVNFAEIEGASKDVTITYQITYSVNGQAYTYTFTRDLTIVNRQSIQVSYPFAGMIDENQSGTTMYFTNQMDGENNGNYISTAGNYFVYSVLNFDFEPVMINQTIDLDYDEIMNVSRLVVTDATQNDSIIDDNFTIEIAGWQNRTNITNYITGGNISIDDVNNTITFNPASNTVFGSGSYGYVVFKITSTSGYVAYYFVQIYNQTSEYPTATSETVLTYEAESGINFIDRTNGAVLGVDLTTNTTTNPPTDYTSTDVALLQFTANDFANLHFYILSAEMLDGSVFFDDNITQFSELTDASTLRELTNYTNIKIGVVLRNSARSILNLGVLNFHIQPIYEEVVSDNNLEHQIEGVSNGEYIRTITINENEINVPFSGLLNRSKQSPITENVTLSTTILTDGLSSGYEIGEDNKSITYNGDNIISIDETNIITLEKYVRNENLQFSVMYTYTIGEGETAQTFVVIVHYTYNELEIDNSTVTINNIGAFNNEIFNNRVNLNQIVGDYKKTITINGKIIDLSNGAINSVEPNEEGYSGEIFASTPTESEGAVTYVFDETTGNSYLEFGLSTQAYTKSFEVTFNDMMGETMSKTVYTNVVSGIYVSLPSGDIGSSSTNPLPSTPIEGYTVNGSSITIEGSDKLNEDTATRDLQYREYTIGGLSIKTSAESSLEFVFAQGDRNYVNDLDITGIYTFNGVGETKNTVNFVHTAQDRVIAITIRIKSGDTNSETYYMNGDQQQTITFYVQISKTYNGLQASYLVSNSNATSLYENVARGSTINDLVSTLLLENPNGAPGNSGDSSISSLTDVAGGEFLNTRRIYLENLDGEYIELTEDMITNIGFNTSGNPNRLTFNAGNYSSLSTNEEGSIITNNLQISQSLTSNTQTNLGISNEAGVNISYTYRIIASDTVAGINAMSDTAGHVSKTNEDVTTHTDYATILVNDTAETSNEEITILTETAIGSTKEGISADMFISSAVFNMNNSAIPSNQISIEKENNATNGTTYTFTYVDGSQRLVVTLRLGTDNRLYISATRQNMLPFDVLDMVFTIYGTGGKISYDTYNVILYNYTISSDYQTSHKQVYATSEIYLLNDITFKSNLDNNQNQSLTAENATILTDGSSYYNIGGTDRRAITELTNDLFEYDDTKNIIKTHAVGDIVYVTLTIEVKDENGYIVAIMQYNFDINVHFEFVINGNTLPSGNSAFNTNYILTNANPTSGASGTGFYEMSYNAGNDDIINTVEFGGITYNTALQLKLRDRTTGTDIRLSNVSIERELSNFGVTFDNENYSIILPKDITGTLIVPLTVDTDNGTYTVNWNINIRGFINLEYIATAGSNAIIRNNGEGFTSNTTVNLAVDASDLATQSGLYMSNTNRVTGTNNDIGSITPSTEYLILPYEEYQYNFNAVELFNEAIEGDIQNANADVDISNNRNNIKITLPRVTQSLSSTRTYYLVVYRVNLTYLNNTTDNYYVTYLVYNNQSVTSEENSTVNVDTNSYENNGEEYLDLFYYKTIYTTTLSAESAAGTTEEQGTYIFEVYLEKDEDNSYNIVMEKYKYGEDTNREKYIESEIIGGNITFVSEDSNNTTRYELTRENIYGIRSEGDNEETYIPYEYGTEDIEILSRYTPDKSNIKSLFTSTFNSILDFKDFIVNIDKIQINNAVGLVAGTSAELDLEYIENGRFGIKLLSTSGSNTTPLKFNNSLVADLDVVMNSGEREIGIPAYSNGAGFRLIASNEITPNTTDITLGDMFLSSEISELNGFNSIEEAMAVQIIGVGTPVSTWAHIYNNSTSTASNGSFTVTPSTTDLATLTVNTGDSTNYTYHLHTVTFSSTVTTNSLSLYNLQSTYYYIEGTSQIVKMDYSSSIQADYYQVNPSYNYDSDNITIISFNDSVFSTSGIIMIYSMENYSLNGTSGLNHLVKENVTPTGIREVTTSHTDTTSVQNSIIMRRETLNGLQGQSSITLEYVATYSSYTLTFRVRFRIPTAGFYEDTETSQTDETT